ncbi:MAG: class I SAM-dependent methyltransferase [Oscillatoriales cyanobacterium SM2_1_8]|nr:class I SAM-dependent methyltransferase [Oscillatoriales cyanobacterium SM2_1_8]
MTDSSPLHPDAVTAAVAQLYDTFPFPPDPVLDEAPPGYNWRWSWPAAYAFCTGGQLPPPTPPRILDAGCGSGVSTEYLAHLNPTADITAIDISAGTLNVARERARRTCDAAGRQLVFRQMSLYDAGELPGEFDLINSVGVLHHLADPVRGLQALAAKLAPGGLLHLFLYAKIGRWEIGLMQEALMLLRTRLPDNALPQAVKLGRSVFGALPETNRLRLREQQRWSLENQRDECFADMYLHPQEIDYEIPSLFALLDQTDLQFVGFSNPHVWQLERLLGSDPECLARAETLSERDRYRLIELLDTDISHYEFFLARTPLPRFHPNDDRAWQGAIPQHHPCLDGWPARAIFDPDYQLLRFTDAEFDLMHACDGQTPVPILLEKGFAFATLRSLLQKRAIVLMV